MDRNHSWSDLVVARSFCELFAAGCIEVRGGSPRLYRALDDVDTSLLDAVERIVVRCLSRFASYRTLLRRASRQVRAELPAPREQMSARDAALWREAGEIIDEALEYHPPATSCSV